MAWQPDKTAGFALAALLAGDRELTRVAAALGPELHARLLGTLPSSEDRESSVRRLLRILRPELDEGTGALPARMRALVARLARTTLQRTLLRDTPPPARAHFHADQALLAVLARIARNACGARRS